MGSKERKELGLTRVVEGSAKTKKTKFPKGKKPTQLGPSGRHHRKGRAVVRKQP